MSRARKSKGDVLWFVPGKKTAFIGSTKATSDLISLLSQELETVQDVFNAVVYDVDAKAILQTYIDNGYGYTVTKNLFR